MKRPNDDIRLFVRQKGLYLYEVAEQLGISEITLSRWLRKPLKEEKKQAIIKAVNELENKVC
jgi:transcriptional regulator with XRE-family HTH domain